jgi:membrane fusion protein (multidrug efflux system)
MTDLSNATPTTAEQQALPDPGAASPAPSSGDGGGIPSPRWRRLAGNMLVRLAVLLVAGAIVVLFITRWDSWVGGNSRQTTDDAYVRGDITPLSAKVEGYLRAVRVSDFQLVKAGDPPPAAAQPADAAAARDRHDQGMKST